MGEPMKINKVDVLEELKKLEAQIQEHQEILANLQKKRFQFESVLDFIKRDGTETLFRENSLGDLITKILKKEKQGLRTLELHKKVIIKIPVEENTFRATLSRMKKNGAITQINKRWILK